MLDEHSLMCDFVWPDVVPANQDFVSADVCGDDRFSPGVRNDVSLHWRMDIDSHEMVNWECQFNGEDRALAGASDWRSVLHCIALMSRLPAQSVLMISEITVLWILVFGERLYVV